MKLCDNDNVYNQLNIYNCLNSDFCYNFAYKMNLKFGNKINLVDENTKLNDGLYLGDVLKNDKIFNYLKNFRINVACDYLRLLLIEKYNFIKFIDLDIIMLRDKNNCNLEYNDLVAHKNGIPYNLSLFLVKNKISKYLYNYILNNYKTYKGDLTIQMPRMHIKPVYNEPCKLFLVYSQVRWWKNKYKIDYVNGENLYNFNINSKNKLIIFIGEEDFNRNNLINIRNFLTIDKKLDIDDYCILTKNEQKRFLI